jgi:hypothetical protein
MTDELKAKFQALVEDAPEPTGLPSDAVFARIKTVRRRRTTGLVAGLATAAVATIALAAGNLTGIDSAPPVTETPNGPKPTAIVPTSTPTSTPTAPKSSIGGSINTLAPNDGETDNTDTDTPPAGKPSSPSNPTSPTTTGAVAPPGPYRLSFRFETLTDPEPDPTNSLSVDLLLVASGSVLAPTFEEGGILKSSKFQDNLIWSETWWGDGTHVQDDWYGGVFCPQPDNPATMKKVSGGGNRPLGHKYAKAGTYKVTYSVTYCTPSGPVKFARSTNVTVTKPPASPKP